MPPSGIRCDSVAEREGSRHFRSLEEQSLRVLCFVTPCTLLRLGFNETSCDLRNVLGSLERLVIDVRKKGTSPHKKGTRLHFPKRVHDNSALWGLLPGGRVGENKERRLVGVVSRMWVTAFCWRARVRFARHKRYKRLLAS